MSETPDETPDSAKAAEAETTKAGETSSPAKDAPPVKRRGRPRKADAEVTAQSQEAEQVEVPDDGTVTRTKPRTVDSDEPGLGWTVQHGVPYPESDALPGQVLPTHQVEGQPVVGGALYVEDEAHPDGYHQYVQ